MKCMAQLNQSLEEATMPKEGVSAGMPNERTEIDHHKSLERTHSAVAMHPNSLKQVLKESRSHDRDSMMNRLTVSGIV